MTIKVEITLIFGQNYLLFGTVKSCAYYAKKRIVRLVPGFVREENVTITLVQIYSLLLFLFDFNEVLFKYIEFFLKK